MGSLRPLYEPWAIQPVTVQCAAKPTASGSFSIKSKNHEFFEGEKRLSTLLECGVTGRDRFFLCAPGAIPAPASGGEEACDEKLWTAAGRTGDVGTTTLYDSRKVACLSDPQTPGSGSLRIVEALEDHQSGEPGE